MPETSQHPAESAPAEPASRVFRRLLGMLRPQAGVVAIALVLLLLSMPGELFPGLVWMYVTDQLITQKPTGATDLLHRLISFDGAFVGWRQLLPSALGWLFGVYLLAEAMG